MSRFNFGDIDCPFCGSDKTQSEDFKNEISRTEYCISGLCQNCQDKFFGEDEEEKE